MEKNYQHTELDHAIYEKWESLGYFKPEVHPDGAPYTLVLPPPNANGSLHFGHAMFTVEDVLIRYHRMSGRAALFLPGTDHAGFETQFVFEKSLAAAGKSRFDYSQEDLYKMIWDFVHESGGKIEGQLRRLGFSLDWSRQTFTLDPKVVSVVYATFKKMYDEGLVYRDARLVNYCTYDGTSFSDLEVEHVERVTPLYYIKYGPLTLATTRPETKFGDTAVAVNPNDSRYKQYIGEEIEIETVLGPAKITVVADEYVDPEFGTGVVKITPAHDFNDFEVAKRHGLPLKQVIGYDGRMNHYAGKFAGLYVKEARRAIVEEMQKKGLIDHIDEEYVHRVGVCYKCKNVIEPLPCEQWFVRVAPLASRAIEAVKSGEVKIFPKSFETHYFQWMENLRDWNISRQIVWGIRIPAWKNAHGEWVVTNGAAPEGEGWEQDTDTFDTWFSSGQWPFATLLARSKGEVRYEDSKIVDLDPESDFNRFYPTSVMETGYDILRAWVSRMIMLGYFATGEAPFSDVVLHGLVNDPYGKKMSKSKGNVVNPLEVIEEYGADAVRFALVYGNSTGQDQSLSYTKLEAAKRFSHKLWNMGRFIQMKRSNNLDLRAKNLEELVEYTKHTNDRQIVEKTQKLVSEVSRHLDHYQFNLASEKLYDFAWHEFADVYIEDVKNRVDEDSYTVLVSVFYVLLQLLHPFIPFVTEEISTQLGLSEEMLIVSKWPGSV